MEDKEDNLSVRHGGHIQTGAAEASAVEPGWI